MKTKEKIRSTCTVLSAKLLNCKIICTSASRVIHVFLEELYQKRELRVPTREAMERFRRIMLLDGQYKSLKVPPPSLSLPGF